MDYLNLTQARTLIPNKTSTEFMVWIVENKLNTRGESANLEIEKEHFYKSFNLPLERPPVFIAKPIILEGQTIKPVDPIKDIPIEVIPPKNAISSAIEVKLPDGKTVGVNGAIALSTEPFSEVTNSEFIDEQIDGIKDGKLFIDSEKDKIVEADKYYATKILESDKIYLFKIASADKYYADKKLETDNYVMEVTNKSDTDLLAKVNELHDLEEKLKNLMPVYEELRKEMIAWKPSIEKMVIGCKVHIGEDVWYQKAVKYFEYLNNKVEEAVK